MLFLDVSYKRHCYVWREGGALQCSQQVKKHKSLPSCPCSGSSERNAEKGPLGMRFVPWLNWPFRVNEACFMFCRSRTVGTDRLKPFATLCLFLHSLRKTGKSREVQARTSHRASLFLCVHLAQALLGKRCDPYLCGRQEGPPIPTLPLCYHSPPQEARASLFHFFLWRTKHQGPSCQQSNFFCTLWAG